MMVLVLILLVSGIPAYVSLFVSKPGIDLNHDACPPPSGLAGTCVFIPGVHCTSDSFCPWGYGCCPEGCGKICKAVTVNKTHPGSCADASGQYGRACENDRQCRRYEKCCNKNGDSGFCIKVRPPTKPST